ncbi:MAG: 4-hydroxy-tetrahydrodipicolinate synthase [Bacteroidetes bacterium]|nr:4-hydroxy-tetrahydrodipicolinate synthase [Bacteroidota bacterium]
MIQTSLRGCGTALVTPFKSDGQIDDIALKKFVDFQIENGVDFLVPCGTTGESATMNDRERALVISTVVKQANHRVPVVAGTGTNATSSSIEYSKQAQDLGADAVLLVGPYYNKPTQKGYRRHFEAVAGSIQIPAILYNVPGRTGGNIEARTILELAKTPNIIGVKEASANFSQFAEILKYRPKDFLVLSGDDALTLPMLSMGADGVISVAGNQIPGIMASICRFAHEGNWSDARDLHYRYIDLMNINFVESNPIPVKYAMYLMGMMEEVYRMPLVPLEPSNKEKMRRLLVELKLIK